MYKCTEYSRVKQHFCISNSCCDANTVRDSFSFLFICCFGRERKREREREREREKEREKEYDGRPFCTDGVKYGTIVHSSPTRDPGAWPPAAVAAAVTLEIRDSQDRRNIAGRKPTKRGPRQCHPVSGSRHDCFNTLRFCSVSSKRQPGRALKIYSNVCESRESDREMCF